MNNHTITLDCNSNQACGLGQYAIDMLTGRYPGPSRTVLAKTEQFHIDSIACGISALACGCNAPHVLREEALHYAVGDRSTGVPMFGTQVLVHPEKAILACASAVREWDANGTNFGYNPLRAATAGEFGHNDYYPVAIAAAQLAGLDGGKTLLAMTLLDEIRGRLAEVFALKNHKIDHVLHGAIASAVVYGAVLGATVDQIESAIGLVVAHHVPFRAIRAGHQLSDSKGASAAISAEVAVASMRRAMRGFAGPGDVFRNPQALFCLFEPPETANTSPFDLTLTTTGDDFAVMGMHFKLGLYEHQSAGAIQGLLDLLAEKPHLVDDLSQLQGMQIMIYEPAFSIIGDPDKRNPQTRQSADHSMVYIIATLIRKAHEARLEGWDGSNGWRKLMLTPDDYTEDETALNHPLTRTLMQRIDFRHGGPDYDDKYPDGIPTQIQINHTVHGVCSSGLVMYPEGHARCQSDIFHELLQEKFMALASLGVDDPAALRVRFSDFTKKSPEEIATLYDFQIRFPESQQPIM